MARTMKDVRNETTVYDTPACKAKPMSWHVGAVEVVGVSGAPGCGLMQTEAERLSTLPVEFFNHQLMACDPSDFDAVRDFVTAWGLPYSPVRYNPFGVRALPRDRKRTEADKAIKQTDELLKQSGRAVVSFAEAQHAIESLQWVVLEMRKAIAGEKHHDFSRMLNAATCNGLVVGESDGSLFRSMLKLPNGSPWLSERLTCAVCNQIIATMADEKPWRLCARDGCGVIFKERPDTNNSRGNAKYCSLRCQKTQEKRNMRSGALNRIQH